MDITVMVLSILLVICFVLIWCQYEAKLSANEQLDARTAQLNDTRAHMALMSRALCEAENKIDNLTYGAKPAARTPAKPKAKRKSAK